MHSLAGSVHVREHPPRLRHANVVLNSHVTEGLMRRDLVRFDGPDLGEGWLTEDGIESAYKFLRRARARDTSAATKACSAVGAMPGTFVRAQVHGVERVALVTSVRQVDPSGLHHVGGSITIADVRTVEGDEFTVPLSRLRPPAVVVGAEKSGLRAELAVYTTAPRKHVASLLVREGEEERSERYEFDSLRLAVAEIDKLAGSRLGWTFHTPVRFAFLVDVGRSVLSLGYSGGLVRLIERTVDTSRPYEKVRTFDDCAALAEAIDERLRTAQENGGFARTS